MLRLILLSFCFFSFSISAEEKATEKPAKEPVAEETAAKETAAEKPDAEKPAAAPAPDSVTTKTADKKTTSEKTDPQQTTAAKETTEKSGDEAPRKILIMDVEGVGVDETALNTTTEIVASAFDGRKNITGVTMSSLKDLASWASAQEAMSCKDKLACLSELSKYADAPEVLKSDLGQVGTQWVLTLVHFDVKTATAKNRLSQTFGTMSEVHKNAKAMVAKVMGWEDIVTAGFKLGKNQKISLAVFNLKTAGVSENIAANLTQVLSAALKEVEGTTVISNDDIQAMMQLEGEKQSIGCSDDMSCLAEIGGALGVDNLVVGHVGKVQDSFVISLRLINPNEGKVDNRLVESFKGQEATLLSAVKFAGWALLGFTPSRKGSLVVTASERNSKLYVDGKEVGVLPMPPIESLDPGRHAIRIDKSRFWTWEGEVYVKPADLTSQWIVLEKKPVTFIELPKNVWMGLTGMSGLSVATGGFLMGWYYYKSDEYYGLKGTVEATTATQIQTEANLAWQVGIPLLATGVILGAVAGGLTPFVVWEE